MKAFFRYAAIAVAATAIFFFLHHLGNQLPYELAKQRFETAFKGGHLWPQYHQDIDTRHAIALLGDPPYDADRILAYSIDTRHSIVLLGGVSARVECQTLLMVLKGGNNTPFFDAVLPKTFEREYDLCKTLKSVVLDGAQLGDQLEKTRYWWGVKALYAIALQKLSVFEIREMTKTGTYFAYLLLAVFLLRFYPRILLLFSPWIVLGFFFSSIRYMSIAAHGLPYLWAVLAAAGLVLMAGYRASPQALRVFCFIAGAVSSYLWDLDFHTSFIIVFIGLFVYFTSGKVKSAALCIASYMVGFLACFILGQLVKIGAYEWLISDPSLWSRFYDGRLVYESGWATKVLLEGGISLRVNEVLGNLDSWSSLLHPDFLFKRDLWWYFVAYGIGDHFRAAMIFTYLSIFALIASAGFASVQACRGRPGLLRDVSFVIGMMFLMWLEFTLPSDNQLKAGRFMFIPHSLCWLCLILVIMDRRRAGNPGAVDFKEGNKVSPGNGKHGAA